MDCMSCSLEDLRDLKEDFPGHEKYKTKKDICKFLGPYFISCKEVELPEDCMSCTLPQLRKLKKEIPGHEKYNTKKDICSFINPYFVSCKEVEIPDEPVEKQKKQKIQNERKSRKKDSMEYHRKLSKCAVDVLRKKGYTAKELLGEGANGRVYIACSSPQKCDYVFKIGKKSKHDEVGMQKKASEIRGIAPKVYVSGICDKNKEYILQERIYGRELLETSIPYDISKIVASIDTYNVLMKGGVYQYDFKANNIMWDEKNNRPRIIDYGYADSVRVKSNFDHLRMVTGLLLQTFVDPDYSNYRVTPLEKYRRKANKEQFWNWALTLNKAVYKYFYDNYKNEFRALLKKHGVDKLGNKAVTFLDSDGANKARRSLFAKNTPSVLDILLVQVRPGAKYNQERTILANKKAELITFLQNMM